MHPFRTAGECALVFVCLLLCSTPLGWRTAAWAKSPPEQRDAKAVELYRRSTELAARGDHAGAIAALEQAARLEPRWLAVRNDLGVELYLNGEPQRAVEQLRTARDLDPDAGPVCANLAFALYDLGQVDAAVEQWRAALDHGARVADTYAGLALGLYKQGKTAEALATYRIAIDHQKDYARPEYLGAGGAGWSRHAIGDATGLLHALESSTPAAPNGGQ
jgi:tetratricopeptide (TPR) repeat protein